MTDYKKRKLAEIQNEVKEFHPLLAKLLPKLPNVVEVEYTHGQQEMGADFVFSKQDDTFGDLEYVGIVAKIGKVHQDFNQIERQIEECEVSRFFAGGKKKIRITEVWVVVTENVTEGAKRKIYDKYKSRKIRFVDNDRLIHLIDEHMPNFWTDLSLEVGEYLNNLHTRNEEADLNASLLPMANRNFYVEQEIYERPKFNDRKLRQKQHQRIDIYSEIKRQKLILIEGGMGSGKSKLLRRLVAHYTTPEVFVDNNILPVPISYRDFYDNHGQNIEDLLVSSTNPTLREQSDNITYLLLIDAIDEKDLSPEEQVNALSELTTHIHNTPRIKAIITSRYLEGLDEPGGLGYSVARYRLSPLTLNKTVEFIREICKGLSIKDRIIEDLKKSPLFKNLPQTPIAAILLAKLINENTKELPSNMTELYQKYVELILGRWDIDKGLQSQKEYQALDNIIPEIARFMLENELNVISIDDAKQIFINYLGQRNLDIDVDTLFRKMTSRCEVIYINNRNHTLTFRHRTFVEFFYAKSLVKKGDLEIDNRAFQLYWMNTIFFYMGILKDCPEILEKIVSLRPSTESERWLRVVNMSNYFLAAYTSPYHIISKGITDVILEAANLYQDVVDEKIESPFQRLSRMQILYLMQFLIRNSYSYEFFQKAFEEAALSIATTEVDIDTKAYVLYFLNVAAIELGVEPTFDFLLTEHQEPLPLDVTLALKYESENLQERTRLMRKQDSYLKRILKGNQRLKQLIDNMYERPINASERTSVG